MTTHAKPGQRTNLPPLFGFNFAIYPWLRVITNNEGGNEKIQQGFIHAFFLRRYRYTLKNRKVTIPYFQQPVLC